MSTGLDGIWTGFLNQPPASERNRVTPTLSKQLPKRIQEIGIAWLHRIGRVGPYELSEKSYDSGPTWEDYLATNPRAFSYLAPAPWHVAPRTSTSHPPSPRLAPLLPGASPSRCLVLSLISLAAMQARSC